MFYSKVIGRSVNTFIPLGDGRRVNQFQSCRKMWVTDRSTTSSTLALPRPNELTSTNVFLQFAKNVEVTRRKIWAVWRMLKCFPAKFLKLIPHHIGSMGTGVILLKYVSLWQHSRAFWLYGASQHPQPPRNEPHLPVLLCLPLFPMLDEQTLHYVQIQSNRETTVWTCVSSLCMSPALQMAVSIRNNSVASFCEECVLWRMFCFHFTAPHRFLTLYNACCSW